MWDDDEDEEGFEPDGLTLSRRQLAAIDGALGTIEATLAEAIERSMRGPVEPVELGGRQEIFCRETLMRLLQNPQLSVGDPLFDGASEALRALDQLRPRLRRLQHLGVSAGRMEWSLSEHVLLAAHSGYAALRASGRHHGLEALHAGLSWRRRGPLPGDCDDSPGFDEVPPVD